MKKVYIVVVAVALLMLLSTCGSDSDSYRDTLESGLGKYYSGQTMTKQEYNAVKGFNKWKDAQGSKTYSAWDK